MLLRPLAFALLLAAPPLAGAETPAEETRADAPKRPFVEQSLVLAPEAAGEWTLAKANDYEGNPGAGVGLNYVHAGHPGVRLDLFVYPIGRLTPDEAGRALDGEIATLRQQLMQMAAEGTYESPRFDEPLTVSLALPAPAEATDVTVETGAGSPAAEGQGSAIDAGTPSAGEAADPAAHPNLDEALLELLAQDEARDRRLPGRKLSIQLGRDGQPLTSRAYVYYHGLFLYKGRITASHQVIAPGVLDALADQAMETLVPLVRVNSTGGCHESVVHVDASADADAAALQMVSGLLASQARAERENCGPTLDETVPAGIRALRLVFPPEAWGAAPDQPPPGRHKSTAKSGS